MQFSMQNVFYDAFHSITSIQTHAYVGELLCNVKTQQLISAFSRMNTRTTLTFKQKMVFSFSFGLLFSNTLLIYQQVACPHM